jgi:class 3 adenylate cyclase
VAIAYQVVGTGPMDLIHTRGSLSHLEYDWEEPSFARYLTRLGSFCRLILFDKRGTGLSDRVIGTDTLEARMDDIRAVMDAAGSSRAAVLGIADAGALALLFAATYPERTSALILYSSIVKGTQADDVRWAPASERYDEQFERIRREWGTPAWVDFMVRRVAPSRVTDEAFRQWLAQRMRLASSPGAHLALMRMNRDIDIRPILPMLHVPTLVLHQAGDQSAPVEGSRYLAASIPGAKYVELPGRDQFFWVDHAAADMVVEQIAEFLTGIRPAPEPTRVLATVMFTDIVDSTTHVARLGDRRWLDLRERHDRIVRQELDRHRGREIDTAGDGFHAHFDGPGRAIRCACVIRERVHLLSIDLRIGLHAGEIELVRDKVGGLAIHIGARVAAQAAKGEVLVTSTVKDLVAGSNITFEDRGVHRLKGMPDEWRLYRVGGGP